MRTHLQNARKSIAILAIIPLIFLQSACSKPTAPPPQTSASTQKEPQSPASTTQQITARIRKEVAGILKKKESEIDIAKPLGAQGADELDLVEIVMAVEEAFKIEIPDEALSDKISEASKTVTVEKLATIVADKKKMK